MTDEQEALDYFKEKVKEISAIKSIEVQGYMGMNILIQVEESLPEDLEYKIYQLESETLRAFPDAHIDFHLSSK